MFSSENNTYPFFYHHQSPSFTNGILENNTTFCEHHHHFHGKYHHLPTFSPTIPENPIVKLSSEPSIHPQNSLLYPSNMINSTRTPGTKKDRHTKISTAQGVRDRRVRLSMNIARDFFNLQDMLGFDKASKTLGWLMAKSKADIDELTKSSDKLNEEASVEETIKEVADNGGKKSSDAKSLSKKRRSRREHILNNRNAAMEVKRREEARNRARERTRNKMKYCKLNQNQSGLQEYMVSKGIGSKDDQESCNYNNDYLCNYGGFPAFNIINLSREIHINAKTLDAYNNQLLH